MTTRIKFKRDTAANWTSSNPILAAGETGFETDTRTIKIGDGVTAWADLKYAVTGDLKVTDGVIHGDTSVGISSGIGNRENWVLLTQSNEGDVTVPTDAYVDSVAYDSQGNAISMGWYDVGDGNGSGCYLQKVSPSGEVLFNQYYNEYLSFGFGMGVDKNDDVVMILGENDASTDDVILVKVSGTDGTIVWQKYINSLGDYDDYASCLDIDAQGDIFIAGKVYGDATPGNCAYVAKFSGANGSNIWAKEYNVEYFDSNGTGLKVDKDGNLAVIGSVSGDYGFVTVYKIDGSDGSIIWQGKIQNVKYDNGSNATEGGNIQSSDITTDTQGNFYTTINSYHPYYPGVIGIVAKFNGSTGDVMWSRQFDWDDYRIGVGSVACDDQDNVYASATLVKYKEGYDHSSSSRATQIIVKLNATGSVIWQRWLSQEQGETTDAKRTFYDDAFGQSIAVKGNYVLVGGTYAYQYQYGYDNNYWYIQPYIAQLNTDGGEFNVDGWKFVDSSKDVTNTFVTLLMDKGNWTYDPAMVTDFDLTITNGTVNADSNTDTSALVYLNKSNVNTMTFSEKTLTLPAGGAINVGREQNGYFTSIGGNFDGNEGWNSQGSVWLNGSARDEKGATYSAGGWYTYNTWNNWSSGESVPLVFKTDSTGKLIWSAGNALDQDWSNPDLVDVVYHQDTNTVVVLGNDGELDGHEGFNVMYLDADTGSMKQDITHIRPADGTNDIWPKTLTVMSSGTPVVSGYIGGANSTYANVTTDGAGLTGSTSSGTLVIPNSIFTIEGTTSYPEEDGTWYLDGSQIYSVNRFGHDEAYPTITYTGTLGSGAVVDVTIASGIISAVVGMSAGSGYKAGQKFKVLGTDLGGTSPENDVTMYVDTVDGSGAITGLVNTFNFSTVPADGTFTSVATTALQGTGLVGWVQYTPEATTYTLFNRDSSGLNYGVGDTFKILGSALGGVDVTNDLTITVTAINGTGDAGGVITDVTLAGTPQSTNIKLYTGTTDFTQAGTYNITHELGSDGFIWTPNWTKVFGGTGQTYLYDDLHGMAVDTSDNVIVGGYSDGTGLNSGTTFYGSYTQTGIITKFDADGALLWAKSIDGSEGHSTVWGIATDAEDNIFSVMSSSDTNGDPYITKLTADGDYLWQQSIQVNNSDPWSIATTDNGDVMIAGYCDGNWFNNNYHHYNNNILIVKFDKDGNTLFSRIIWSQNGVRMNYNDSYSNQLTIKGDRFSIAAYSNDPGDYDNSGLVIDLPLDGSGAGAYGDFFYEEVETERPWRFESNDAGGHPLVTDITDTLVINPYEFVEAPYIEGDAWRNVSIYADRQGKVNKVYKPEGGAVTGVAKIVFEDGTEQTSSMQGLPQVPRAQSDTGRDNYWLRPEDNGKHIFKTYSDRIYIPHPGRLYLPVGYAITIITRDTNCSVGSEDGGDDIYLSGDDGGYDSAYTIPNWTMATLVKVEDGTWVISGGGLTSGWY